MKLITRDTDYAVRALCYLAKHRERTISVPELVKALEIPRPFLRKILQLLHNKGILKAYKGKGGGFSMAISPGRISLIEVMRVFQGQFSLNECLFKKECCPRRYSCGLRKKIMEIERQALKDIGKITIGNLARD
ncbi:MAG: Rrf2 family transcriptional regulator [Candidatus Omnitrophica bacterium]|nr:Rrf2 family transcriptional regulator [Candidatus Omnitrophota bacterium]